jgi:single stranded DNA-binding protein
MMKYGVNRVTLVGNVGDEPRASEGDGEAFVANFPLATNEVWRDKEGEEVRRTEWHNSVVDVVDLKGKQNYLIKVSYQFPLSDLVNH